MALVFGSAGKVTTLSPALLGMCLFCNAHSMQFPVVLQPSLKRNGPVAGTWARFSEIMIFMVSRNFAASVFSCRQSYQGPIRSSREETYTALSLNCMPAWYERWTIRTLSRPAVPDIQSDPGLLLSCQVGETSECRDLFQIGHQMWPSALFWNFEYVARLYLKTAAFVCDP